MGMSVSLDLLAAIYPIAISPAALEHDLHQLEAARFMRPTEVPGTWFMTHVRVLHTSPPKALLPCMCTPEPHSA